MIRPGRVAARSCRSKILAVAFTQALSGDVIYVSPGTYDQGTTALVISIQRPAVGSGAGSSTIGISGLTRWVVEPLTRFVHSGFHTPTAATSARPSGLAAAALLLMPPFPTALLLEIATGTWWSLLSVKPFPIWQGRRVAPPEPRIVLMPGERWKNVGSPVTKPNAAVELT